MSWPTATIEKIASVKGGKRLPQGHDFLTDPTDHLYIRARDIGNNRISVTDAVYLADDTFGKIKNYTVAAHDLLVTIVGANIGDVGFVTNEYDGANLTENAAKIRVNEEVCDPRFLSFQLSTPRAKEKFQLLTGGSAQGKLGLYKINAFDVVLPPITVQKRIAVILSAYEDLIENNRRRIQLLEQSARLLYKEWFVHLRFPGHEHVNIKDGVPEGWEDTFLPDVIDVNPKTPVEKGKEILYVPMSALSETGMTADTRDFEWRTTHTTVKFQKKDVLLARITPCLENGKTGFAYFLGDGEIACGSTEFIVLRGRRVSPAFTYCLARSYPFRGNAIKSMIGSSGRQRVQVSCFDEFKVPVPSIHFLDMFDEVANAVFEQIRVLVAQNDKLANARDLLLPRLMNGEVAA